LKGTVTVREEIDPAHFAALRRSCGLAKLDEEMVTRALGSSLVALSAMDGPRAVGMIRVVGDGAFAFIIYDLLVSPPWRRRGIGSLLVKEALRRTAAFAPEGEWVTVGLFCAEGREGFYARQGFKELSGDRFGTGMQRIYKAEEISIDS